MYYISILFAAVGLGRFYFANFVPRLLRCIDRAFSVLQNDTSSMVSSLLFLDHSTS